MTEETQSSSHSAWGDRIRALRNVPAVLRIMWDSGRSVVAWGLILRVIVPVLGLLIGIVAARIITGVARALEHQPQFPHFWWLVASEVVLALLTGIMTRSIDYTDQMLADRYTYYVSVRVMEQAAQLDLTTYEDPVYYDRLERARVQATDRLALIQQMGRLFQQVVLTLIWSGV